MHIFVIDPGSSRTKAIASSSGGKPQFLSMSPYCSEGEVKRERDEDVSIESAWVDVGACTYLVGEDAKKYGDSRVANDEMKYRKAVYKALAVIGYFAKELNIAFGADISVGVLLPFNEFLVKEKFVQEFSDAVCGFNYCGDYLAFKLVSLTVRAEGAGVYIGGLPRKMNPKLLTIASLVIGHRNASWLMRDKGRARQDASVTCDLGYRWLVKEVMTQTGHSDERELWVMGQIFRKGDREICEAAKSLLPSYWRQLERWIKAQEPVEHIIVSGGAGLLLRQQIDPWIKHAIWPDALLEEAKKYEPNEAMAFRFVDALGIYKSLEAKARVAA